MLQIKLLRDNSRAPSRAHPQDGGLDIINIEDKITIKSGDKVKIATGFAMSIPTGFIALITPRSGLGSREELVLANLVGVVDSTYRGEVYVTMKNNGKKDVTVETGDRFAQMVITSCELWPPEIVTDLPDTARGSKGFGGTGK